MARNQSAAADDGMTSFLNPDNATAGLRNLFEGTIVDARFEAWDFKGKAKAITTRDGRHLSGQKFSLHLVVDDIDDGGKAEDIYWPGMAIEDCVPNDDGTGFEFITGRKGFPKDSELIQGMQYMIDSGAVAKSDLSNDPTIFIGKRFFWERKAAMWAKPQEGKSAPEQLMPVKFISDEGGSGKDNSRSRAGAAASSKPAPRAGAAAAAADGSDDAIVDRAKELVIEALDDLPKGQKTVSREMLGSEVLTLMLTKYKKGPDEISVKDRKAIGALFEDDVFLEGNAGRRTWKYDAENGEVTKVG